MRQPIIVATLLLLAAPLGADPWDHHQHPGGRQLMLSISAGGFFGDTLDEGDSQLFEEGVDLDETVFLEARFGFMPNEWFELEGAVSYAPSEFVLDSNDGGLFGEGGSRKLADVDVWHYTLNTNFHFPVGSDFDPFFTVGAGAATYDIDFGNVDADTKFAFVIGGGFNYWLAEAVGLRFDAKDLITIIDVDNDYDYECDCYYDYDTESNTLHNAVVAGGLVFRFH